jgi:hypothetical protein
VLPGPDPACDLAGLVDPNTGICVPGLPADPGCLGTTYGGVPEGPNDPHPGACNVGSTTAGPLPLPQPPYPGFPLSAGTKAWVVGDAMVLLNAVESLRVGSDPCSSVLAGDPGAALIPLTTGTATTGVMDADAATAATLSHAETGAPFSCLSILNSVATGAALSYAAPSIDAGLATSDVAAAIKLTAQ